MATTRRNRFRASLVGLGLAVGIAGQVTPAHATQVRVVDDIDTYLGSVRGDDRDNEISIERRQSGAFVIRDPESRIEIYDESDGRCEQRTAHRVHCERVYMGTVSGGPGHDEIRRLPGSGGGSFFGGEGNDVIIDAEGDSTIYGDKGKDTLRGGRGNDRFVIAPSIKEPGVDQFFAGRGKDRIKSVDNTRDQVVSCGPGYDIVRFDRDQDRPSACERRFARDDPWPARPDR